MKKTIIIRVLCLFLAGVFITGCNSEPPKSSVQQSAESQEPETGLKAQGKIRFGELPWDAARVATSVVRFIVEKGYGYETEAVSGQTIVLWQGLRQGDVDIQLEVFPQTQQKAYNEAIAEGSYVRLGYSYNTTEGWYVPTYVIKGDPKRNLKPLAPDLKTVEDLPKYWNLFKDPEVPTRGRLFGGVPGWEAEKTTGIKFKTLGLDKYYTMIRTGSAAAQAASLASAYKKGEPWLGYYWAPSWPLAKYDLTRITEPVPYDSKLWEPDRACDWPVVYIETGCNSKWLKTADPELVAFLCKFTTSTAVVNKYLLHGKNSGSKAEQTAIWFLKELEEEWTKWVPLEIAKKVRDALSSL